MRVGVAAAKASKHLAPSAFGCTRLPLPEASSCLLVLRGEAGIGGCTSFP